jgi:hypothetical protein
MQNMSKTGLSDVQRDFIDALAALLAGWAMPNNAARVYGYLQIRNGPASLDDIARDLDMSKSNAWAAARQLEYTADVRRLTERGSKRVSYIAGDDPGAPLRRQADLLGQMSDLIANRTADVSSGPAALRMNRLGRFHRDLQIAMQAVIMPDAKIEAA